MTFDTGLLQDDSHSPQSKAGSHKGQFSGFRKDAERTLEGKAVPGVAGGCYNLVSLAAGQASKRVPNCQTASLDSGYVF